MSVTDLFTKNKQKVRDLDTLLIQRYFKENFGQLRYFGLPASTLTDIAQWNSYFNHFSVVERGKFKEEYLYQHELMLTAMKLGISTKIFLFRGDMDDILLSGKDEFGNTVQYPYDVVSLDYSGGILYKTQTGEAKRPESISKLFEEQAKFNRNFLLFLSTNMDIQDRGEIRLILTEIEREQHKLGIDISHEIKAFIDHPNVEARLKIYIPYLLRNLSQRWFRCTVFKPVCYLGNKETRMMHFSFWLDRTSDTVAGKPSQQTIETIINLTAFECRDGELFDMNFDIQKVNIN